MSKNSQHDDYDDMDEQPGGRSSKPRPRSTDFDQKRRRAERILEQARLRELLGYDIDYED